MGGSWSWVQFCCATLLVGLVAFLNVGTLSLGAHLLLSSGLAAMCGCLAGRFGDAAWRWIVGFVSFVW